MFDSQPVETAFGLILMFFVIALGASSIVELISQCFKIRAKDLETAVGQMLSGRRKLRISDLTAEEKAWINFVDTTPPAPDRTVNEDELRRLGRPLQTAEAAFAAFKGTSVYEAAAAGAKRGQKMGRPSYLAARSFAEGVGEMLGKANGVITETDWDALPEGLKRRLTSLDNSAKAIAADAKQHALAVKSGLEQWFDETMARVGGAYTRWSKKFLLVFGLIIAVSANASTFHVAEKLWHDPVVRAAVANAADHAGSDQQPADLGSVADTTNKLVELKLPIGWDRDATKVWHEQGKWYYNFDNLTFKRAGAMLAMLAGWLLTGFLVALGAPFWFNLLTKIASLRSTGARPPTASADSASSTALLESSVGASGGTANVSFVDGAALRVGDEAVMAVQRVGENRPAPTPTRVPVGVVAAFGLSTTAVARPAPLVEPPPPPLAPA